MGGSPGRPNESGNRTAAKNYDFKTRVIGGSGSPRGYAWQFDEFVELDGWIRRRIRMCYWKQWRHPRTKVHNLVRLGVSLTFAIKHAISRKSYWRMSRTPAMRYAMPNTWLEQQLLPSSKRTRRMRRAKSRR